MKKLCKSFVRIALVISLAVPGVTLAEEPLKLMELSVKVSRDKLKKIITPSGKIQLKKLKNAKKKKIGQPKIEGEALYWPAELKNISLTVSREKPQTRDTSNRQDFLKKLGKIQKSREVMNKNRRTKAPPVTHPNDNAFIPGRSTPNLRIGGYSGGYSTPSTSISPTTTPPTSSTRLALPNSGGSNAPLTLPAVRAPGIGGNETSPLNKN